MGSAMTGIRMTQYVLRAREPNAKHWKERGLVSAPTYREALCQAYPDLGVLARRVAFFPAGKPNIGDMPATQYELPDGTAVMVVWSAEFTSYKEKS